MLPLFFVMTQLPHGRQVIEPVQSPPQGYRSGLAVVLASHKPSQLRHPAHGLPHGRRLLGRHGSAIIGIVPQHQPAPLDKLLALAQSYAELEIRKVCHVPLIVTFESSRV
jgi:hypothetical protein